MRGSVLRGQRRAAGSPSSCIEIPCMHTESSTLQDRPWLAKALTSPPAVLLRNFARLFLGRVVGAIEIAVSNTWLPPPDGWHSDAEGQT